MRIRGNIFHIYSPISWKIFIFIHTVGLNKIMTSKQFRFFLTLSWLLSLLSIVISFLAIDTLPIELREYIKIQQDDPINTTREIIYFISGFPLIAGEIVSIIGLYLWKKWARILYIAMFMYGFIVQLIGNSPTIYPLLGEPFFTASNILSGIVICSMYFCTGINVKFMNNISSNNANEADVKKPGGLP